MSEEERKLENDVEALKTQITEMEAENQRLRETIGKAEDTLKAYVDREKRAAIEAILEKSNWGKDELEKLDMGPLLVPLKAPP